MAAAADVQYSVHAPNAYLCDHQSQLLPGWSQPIRSLLVVQQQCPLPLNESGCATEASKALLRDRFLTLGHTIAQVLTAQGYRVAYFDPKTGLPANASAGGAALDDVAVVQSLLGYEVILNNRCWCLVHPIWGQAVYPATLVSTASPSHLLAVVQAVVPA